MSRDIDIIKLRLSVEPEPTVPDISVVNWNGKMLGICHNLMQVEWVFLSGLVHHVLCIDVPNCKYVATLAQAARFYLDGEDNDPA
jgi:hypothetical protein